MSYPAPNYTQIPNLLLEDHIKAMTEAEMRVALAIARKTFGWHKRQDKLSLSQLMNLTGMSRQGVINGIEAGIARGIIRREQDGQSFLYELVILDKPVNEVGQSNNLPASQPSGPELVNEVDQLNTETSQRSRHTKERNKRNKLNKSNQGVSRAIAAPPAPPPATPVSERMGNEEYEHPLTKSLLPSPPIAAPPSPKRITSPHFDPRRLRDGYIPAGEGVNPVEIYFERYSANECKLNAPSQDDLIRAVTDLGRWRQVVIAWQQSGYKPANIKGMLDWYHDPSKIPGARSDNGKEKSSGHHATTPAPEPGRYAKLKAGKVT